MPRAEDIFRVNIGSLEGKTTRKRPEQVVINNVDLPEGLFKKHGNITLETDIMYISGIPFVINLSRGIYFCAVKLIKYEKIAMMSSPIDSKEGMYVIVTDIPAIYYTQL